MNMPFEKILQDDFILRLIILYDMILKEIANIQYSVVSMTGYFR